MKTNDNSFENVIKSTSGKTSILFDFRKTWIAYLVLVALIIASFFIKDFVQERIDADIKTEFEKSYSSIITRLNNQHDRLFQIMQSTQGLYHENVQVVRDYFELTGSAVKNFSSIICMTYAPKVMFLEWGSFRHNALSQGYIGLVPYELKPPGVREYYYPVEHIVVFEKEMQRLAFDYGALPIMKTAIEFAQAENIIVSTEFFDLRPNVLSFALIAPIYRRGADSATAEGRKNNFKGSVVMEVDAEKYFASALAGATDHRKDEQHSFLSDSLIAFTVTDKDSQGNENIVFRSRNYFALETSSLTPNLTEKVVIEIANRDLTVEFVTVPGFINPVQANLPFIAFAVSLLISFIAFLLIIVLLTQKARAEEIAEKMTASQRRILDTSKDIIAVISSDGTWLSMNPISIVLLGAAPSSVVGTKITDYFYDEKDVTVWKNILAQKDDRQIEMRIKSTSERNYIWVSWNFTMPKNENLVYAIGRDVTLERDAAEEFKFRAKQIELAHCYEKEATTSKVHLMVQLSHEMRNQLTSIMGYLQLITQKAYDSEEELLSYADSASASSESAFAYIHDIAETTIGDSDTTSKMSISNIENTILPAIAKYNKANKASVNLEFAEQGKQSRIIVDEALISDVWFNLFSILTKSNPSNEIMLTANENLMEGVTEIVLEADTFADLNRLIDIYNSDNKNVIERLREDTDDILLNLAKTASFVSLMSGVFGIEKMYEDKTAYIFITLPLVMKIRE